MRRRKIAFDSFEVAKEGSYQLRAPFFKDTAFLTNGCSYFKIDGSEGIEEGLKSLGVFLSAKIEGEEASQPNRAF